MARTYYELLGVRENATDAEIQAAFKTKAREVHPDKVAPETPYLQKVAAEAFKDLSEAKSVLLDHDQRSKYDAGLAYMRGSTSTATNPSSQPPPQSSYSSGPSSQTSPPPSSSSQTGPLRSHAQSFWKPINSKLGIAAFAAGGFGSLLLLSGNAETGKTAPLGFSLILICFGLLCWRHGRRPGTNPKILGGGVFLFVFALILLDVWLESSSDRAQPAVHAKQAAALQVQSPSIEGSTRRPSDFGNVPGSDARRHFDSGPQLRAKSLLKENDSADRGKSKVVGKNATEVTGNQVISSVHTDGRTQPGSSPPADAEVSPEPNVATANRPTSSGSMSIPSRDLESLSYGEKTSLESACSHAKYIDGPAAYRVCIENQLDLLASARRHPDLSSLGSSEQQSIESACSHAKFIEGPAAYDRCLEAQLKSVASAPQRPDLSGLSYPEQQSVESVCSHAKFIEGPAAYDRCLDTQLRSVASASQRPDLSGLSYSEQQSIESACSHAKFIEGPAAYDRCLIRQLKLLGPSSH